MTKMQTSENLEKLKKPKTTQEQYRNSFLTLAATERLTSQIELMDLPEKSDFCFSLS